MFTRNLAVLVAGLAVFPSIAAAECPEIFSNGLLGAGLDLGLNTSGGRTDWFSIENQVMVMKYPAGQQFGFVFITNGPPIPPGNRPGRDLSACQNLVIELSGDPGPVKIGLKDVFAPDDGTEKLATVQVTSDWRTITLPLSGFAPTDLRQLYILSEFIIEGSAARTLRVRHIEITSKTVLPQVAFGGGWYSALYFTNTSDQARQFDVDFLGNDGRPLSLPSGASTSRIDLAAGGSAVIEAPNAGSLKEGYASFSLPLGVVGYGVFRQSAAGRADQEAVVPLSDASSKRSVLIWDDSGLITAVALLNPSTVSGTVSITVRDGGGQVLGRSTVVMPAGTKQALALRDLPGLSSVTGKRGSAEFTINTGSLAVLGLRFNGSAFTSIPVAGQ